MLAQKDVHKNQGPLLKGRPQTVFAGLRDAQRQGSPSGGYHPLWAGNGMHGSRIYDSLEKSTLDFGQWMLKSDPSLRPLDHGPPERCRQGSSHPGHAAVGWIGKNLLVYLKKLDDGSVLHLEEVREGRKQLAMHSMRKYPSTIAASSILTPANLNARSDGGDKLIIVDVSRMIKREVSRDQFHALPGDWGDLFKAWRTDVDEAMLKANQYGVDDEVFYEPPEHGLTAGRVRSIGRDGFMVDGDKPHGVVWDGFRGHKKRAERQYHVVDRGESGAIGGRQKGGGAQVPVSQKY